MKIKNILLSSIIILNMFSFCSCSSSRTINTVGYVNLYNENLKTVKIKILPGFNYENLTIPSYVKINGDDYKVTGLYVSDKDDEFFLKDNMYIKHVKVESEFISTFGYDVFRNTSLETLDISKATGLGQIGDHAFAYSSSLREVKMAPNVYKIYKGVFIGTNIKEINFTDTLEEIGINNFLAFDCPTATAILEVTSPYNESAITIPIGPIIISASLEQTTTGFSPVATTSALALSIASVASALVPIAITSTSLIL